MAQHIDPNTNEIQGIFARVGEAEGDPMSCFFNLPVEINDEVVLHPAALLIDPESLETKLHNVKKDGTLGAELGVGTLTRGRRSEEDANSPDWVGVCRTKRGNWLRIAAWEHEDEVLEDAYLALRIRPYQRRKGKMIGR